MWARNVCQCLKGVQVAFFLFVFPFFQITSSLGNSRSTGLLFVDGEQAAEKDFSEDLSPGMEISFTDQTRKREV